MKTKILSIAAIMLVVAGSFSSCAKKGETNDDVFLKINEITEIKVGKNELPGRHGPSLDIVNELYGLSLRVALLNDERCPIGLQCSEAGTAFVDLNLKNSKGVYDFSFTLNGKGIVIEGIKYRLMDVLPYPVFQKDQPERTVKILVSEHSILADTQWKVVRYQNKDPEMPTLATYNLSEPYIIHFKNDFTVECTTVCRFHQGTYIAGNDGSIGFDEISAADYQNCEFAYQWEIWVYNSLQGAREYTIVGNQLILEGPPWAPLTLYLEKI